MTKVLARCRNTTHGEPRNLDWVNLRIGSATYERTTVNQTVFGLAHRQTSPASIARRFANDLPSRSVVKFDVALRTWPSNERSQAYQHGAIGTADLAKRLGSAVRLRQEVLPGGWRNESGR